MKSFIFLLFLSSLVGGVYAFDCSLFASPSYEACLALSVTSPGAIANLIYTNTSSPDHEFVASYNDGIIVTGPPEGYQNTSEGVIKDAWLVLLSIQPSMLFEGRTYVPAIVTARSEYGYSIELPPDYRNSNRVTGSICKILYSLEDTQENYSIVLNGETVGSNKISNFSVPVDSVIRANLELSATTKVDTYRTTARCCGLACESTCYSCSFSLTTYKLDNLTLQDYQTVAAYNHSPNASFILTTQYADSVGGELTKDNLTYVRLDFNQSHLLVGEFVYSANFTKAPYDFIALQATRQRQEYPTNLFYSNGSVTVKDSSACNLVLSDFFDTKTLSCARNITGAIFTPFKQTRFSSDLKFGFKLLLLILLILVLIRFARKKFPPLFGVVLAAIAALPGVRADDCGITNLATCIPQKFFEFLIGALNAPLQPLLDFTRSLIENPPSIALFQGVWQVIVALLSILYGFLFLYAGYQFMTSGHDVVKRELAKESLKNAILLIIFVQASFYLYGLMLELGSALASTVLVQVDPAFFQLTADNVVNVALEFLLVLTYAVVLLATIVVLTLRYLVVAAGVIFAPVGIFCYFVPPLRSYGKLILNLLGMAIFSTFLASIIILASSMLVQVELFQNFKIVIMITCFLLVNLLFLVLGKHIITKSALGDMGGSVAQAAKYLGGVI